MKSRIQLCFTLVSFVISLSLRANHNLNFEIKSKALITCKILADAEKPDVTCQVGPCEPAKFDTNTKFCKGHISLNASATDNETFIDDLMWEYKIDLYNDGRGVHGGYDFRVGKQSRNQKNQGGDTIEFSHNPFADDNYNSFNASGTYPIGIHRIKWIVCDSSGNIGICEKLFEIEDCMDPIVKCVVGFYSIAIPSSKCVDIFAKNMDQGSYDNCTPYENLKYYFDRDQSKSKITICCDDFVAAGQTDELRIMQEVSVEDEAGNVSFCNVAIHVMDILDVCHNGPPSAKISGKIVTEHNVELRKVNVRLESENNAQRETIGSPFGFVALTVPKDYTIVPSRNDDPLNGVSTADIVKIQKHILGQSRLPSPYMLIAADVNSTGSITASDISEMRKLILGVQPTFSKVASWTFIPSDYVFLDPAKPYVAPRKKVLQVGEPKEYTSDFIGIKMGDVNGTANPGLNAIEIRTSSSLNLVIENINILANQTYKIPIRAEHFTDIEGFQFTLNYDPQHLIYQGVEPGAIRINASYFGDLQNGVLTSSWNSDHGVTLSKDEVLFYIIFKGLQNGELSRLVNINNDIIFSEIYSSDESSSNIQLSFTDANVELTHDEFILFQNVPNPFKGTTVIRYYLPDDAICQLIIYDVMGKKHSFNKIQGKKGLNDFIYNVPTDLNDAVLFYRLVNPFGEHTRRMTLN